MMDTRYLTVRQMIEKELHQETRQFWRVAYLSDVVSALAYGIRETSGKYVGEEAWKASRHLILELYDKLIQLAEAAGYTVEDGRSSIRIIGRAKVLVGNKVVEVSVDTKVPTPFTSDADPDALSFRIEGELLDRIAKIADFFFWATGNLVSEHRTDLLQAVGIQPESLYSLVSSNA